MNGSVIVGGWGVLMLVATAGCGEDGAPREVSAPTSSDASGDGANGAVSSAQDPAPSAGESGAVPSQPASTEAETTSPSLDLAPSVPAVSDAPAAADDGSTDDGSTDDGSSDDGSADDGSADDGGADDGSADDGSADAPGTETEPWRVLFNGQNLDGWTVARGAGAGQSIEEIFQVTDGMIHVYKGAAQGSTQPIATLRTNDSYSNYVFQFEYMWGMARFSDRSNTERDAGVLFHLFNDLDAVWPDSFELQMGSSPLGGEWVSGDIFVIGSNPRGETTSIRSGNNFVFAEPEMGGMRRPIGAPNSYDRGRTNARLDGDGWNTVELTVRGAAEAEYKVNGVVVNRVFNMERNAGGGFQPLDSGPIALQAEFAELFYRNVRLRELP